MTNREKCEIEAREIADKNIYHRERSTLSKTQAEVIILEALLKRDGERGR